MDPLGFGIGQIPPYGIGIPPLEEAEKEEVEKEAKELAKELSFDKIFPWLEKEFEFDNGVAAGMDLEKELELDKIFGMGFDKGIGLERSFGWEKAMYLPWSYWEKYFGIGKKKLTFQQALAIELFKKYSYFGIWVARELERRFSIAKKLGLIGEEIVFEEAIKLGLFKGIGLDKIFEEALKAAGVEKAAASKEATRESLEKVFGVWKF